MPQDKQVQVMVVNVNHVAKVVIVLLPWLLLLVIFALGVGLLILEVSDVVNAKVGNMVLLMVTTHVYAKIAKKEDILADFHSHTGLAPGQSWCV